MDMDKQTNGDKLFSWAKFWGTPFGVFVVVITLFIGLGTYTYLQDRQETMERRAAFCRSELKENREQHKLWNGIVVLSEANPDKAYVVVEGRRYPVVFDNKVTPAQREGLQALLDEAFPIGDCLLDPNQVPKPKPKETGSVGR